jgi:uncharacterized protein
MKVDDETLKKMTNAIVEGAKPEKIVLFGSQARGDTNEHSDVDLIVVVPSDPAKALNRRALSGRLYRLLAKFGIPKDILVYTTDEVAKWEDDLNHCIGRGLREGKVIYERH